MKDQLIIALTGPAGLGKTTVATLLAKRIPQCVNIDADHVKHFIVNGFIYDGSAEGILQWQLMGDNIGLLAQNFHQAGYSVIISGYINETAWESVQQHISLTHKILLMPHLSKMLERDAERAEDYQMGKEAIKVHHQYFSSSHFFVDFEKLDSTNHTAHETAAEILKLIQN